jgi:hypothetical protein
MTGLIAALTSHLTAQPMHVPFATEIATRMPLANQAGVEAQFASVNRATAVMENLASR